MFSSAVFLPNYSALLNRGRGHIVNGPFVSLNKRPWQVRSINPLAATSDLTELVRLQTQTGTEGSDPFCWSLEH